MGQRAIRAADTDDEAAALAERYRTVRALSEALAAPLSDADATLQSMDDASPAKWHLAHTTWFFETFVLRERYPGYRGFDARWPFLFNSYYEAEGERIARCARGLLSRPSLDEVLAYRAHVDQAMAAVLADPACAARIALGLAHEQQHQELLLTDIKHALWCNPLGPAYCANRADAAGSGEHDRDDAVPEGRTRRRWSSPQGWRSHPGGIVAIGHDGHGFAFDCEQPCHQTLLRPFALAKELVANADWDEFVAAGGYRTASLWLSDGWAWMKRERIEAPLYWRGDAHFTLAGWQPRDPDAPVAHISYYEADAFAAWKGARLPTEAEWEALAAAEDRRDGRQLDRAGAVEPAYEATPSLFGNLWQWTRSAFLPHPGFRPAAGALGEYNGKFMSGQFVLKGASCATPRGHSRPSYRNFFYPHHRWQFTGLRLARDLEP